LEKPRFFRSPAEFRTWLEKHHRSAAELWLGFHKAHARKRGITYSAALDEALCVGWIDGIRKSMDDDRYMIRFTPRKASSKWSRVNVERVGKLIRAGRMRTAGLEAFERRDREKAAGYSYEERPATLEEPYAAIFKRNRAAWEFFQSQAPWYQRTCAFWVTSAKQEATRLRRLDTLIRESQNQKRVGPAAPPVKKAVRKYGSRSRRSATHDPD
jgi:uncharacterized protein YdeI (YjbR/CyaY-like superfamily)